MFFVLCILVLSGCHDGLTYLNVSDSAHCVVQCNQLIKRNFCLGGVSDFGSHCACIMSNCFKNVITEKQPENYSGFGTERIHIMSQTTSQLINRECYLNSKKVNCSIIGIE